MLRFGMERTGSLGGGTEAYSANFEIMCFFTLENPQTKKYLLIFFVT